MRFFSKELLKVTLWGYAAPLGNVVMSNEFHFKLLPVQKKHDNWEDYIREFDDPETVDLEGWPFKCI